MSGETVLVPREQTSMDFFGQKVPVMVVQEGSKSESFVPLPVLCDVLGIDWNQESARVEDDATLSGGMRYVLVSLSEVDRRPLLCLPQDHLYGWLLGIDFFIVKPELQPAVEQVIAECHQVLADKLEGYWFSTELSMQEVPADDSSAAEAHREILAACKLVDNQIMMRLSREEVEHKLAWARIIAVHSGQYILYEQQVQMSQAVDSVLNYLHEHGDIRDGFFFFLELHRCFQISSYRQLSQDKFDEAISWINEQRGIDYRPYTKPTFAVR